MFNYVRVPFVGVSEELDGGGRPVRIHSLPFTITNEQLAVEEKRNNNGNILPASCF